MRVQLQPAMISFHNTLLVLWNKFGVNATEKGLVPGRADLWSVELEGTPENIEQAIAYMRETYGCMISKQPVEF